MGETIMNVLAIGAHPDDIEIFCGGTLLKYRRQGHKVFLALTTSGNIGSNLIEGREAIAATREEEQLEAARFYDAEVRFLRHDDEGLIDSQEARRQVINVIRWADPEVIFTNSTEDRSTDHNTTAQIVSRVLLSLPGKNVPADEPPIQKFPTLFHWDTAAGVHFHPEVYVDISDTFDDKIKALECHRSQFAWMDTFQIHTLSDHCRIMAEFRGLQADVRYAEGFRAFRIHGYMPDFRTLPA
jgi:LmbE family N-acetylglucosaminyl deacetylase